MLKKIIVIIFFISITLLYLHNLTRDVYSGDIGDLVTAGFVGGVAHPPGYPLFSLLGFILSHLPIPLPVVSKIGLISVFSSLLGLIIYYKFCLKTTKSVFLSLLSTSIVAFSYLFWLSAEIPEGLALANFFCVIILYLSFQFYEKKKIRYLYLLSFFAGLSLGNQWSIISLFPAVLLLILNRFKVILSKKRFIFALLFFVLGFSIYIYVPIAASRNPPINWDNATNLKNFIHLILRFDYGGTKTTNNVPTQVKIINIIHYLRTIVSVFSYQVLFVVLLGLIEMFKQNKRLFIFLVLAFLLTGVVSVFYFLSATIFTATSWGILERYYGLSTVVLMFFVPYGFLLLKQFLDSKFTKPIYSFIIISYFLIIPILLLEYNFPKTELSKTDIGNNLARNFFTNLAKNSVLFVSGDNTTFSVWYVYYVLKERQDLNIINPPGVGNDLYLNREINEYFRQNPKTQIKDIIQNTFAAIRKKRKMFATSEISPMPKDTILIPIGLVYEIVGNRYLPSEDEYLKDVEESWRHVKVQRRETLSLSEQNFIASEIPFIYSSGLVRVGDFLNNQYNDPKMAEHYYRRALWIDDTNPQAYSGLAISLYKAYKDCNQSLQNIKQAISIFPFNRIYYIQQYYFSKNCNLNNRILANLGQQYKSLFGESIEKQIRKNPSP